MRRYALRPRRRWSQHFLVDPRVADRVVAEARLAPQTHTLEVGPGLGALTVRLARQTAQVVAVERDPALAVALRWVLDVEGKTVQLVVADVLSLDLDRLLRSTAGGGRAPGGSVAVANVPYAITSELVLRLVRGPTWQRLVLMVQAEVAGRLAASPGSGAYGALSVAVQARGLVQRRFDVSRRCFWPVPEVDSTVVVVERRPDPVDRGVEAAFEAVVRAGFGQRRKTLRNALQHLGPRMSGAVVQQVLAGAGIDGQQRAEELSPEQFARVARAWQAMEQTPGTQGVLP